METYMLLLYALSVIFGLGSLAYSIYVSKINKKRLKAYQESLIQKRDRFQKKMQNLGHH